MDRTAPFALAIADVLAARETAERKRTARGEFAFPGRFLPKD